MLLQTAIPLHKSDQMRPFIEETGYKLTHSSHLAPMIPSVVDKELKALVQPLTTIKVLYSVIFDGTTHVCEAFGVVLRSVVNFEICQVL